METVMGGPTSPTIKTGVDIVKAMTNEASPDTTYPESLAEQTRGCAEAEGSTAAVIPRIGQYAARVPHVVAYRWKWGSKQP